MRGYQYLLLVLILGLLAAAFWQFYVSRLRSAPPVTATVLWQAVTDMDEPAVSELLEAFPDYIRGTDEHGRTLLHHAIRQGREDANALATIRVLIAHNADVDARDHQGQRPLHIAAQQGLPKAANLLLAVGAMAGAEDQNGHTPLVVAEEFRLDQFTDIGADNRLKDRRAAVAEVIRQHQKAERRRDK